MNEEILTGFLQAGVNRLSLGVQTAFDESLARLGRPHTAAQSREAFRAARQAGFANISGDIMICLLYTSPFHGTVTDHHQAADCFRCMALLQQAPHQQSKPAPDQDVYKRQTLCFVLRKIQPYSRVAVMPMRITSTPKARFALEATILDDPRKNTTAV